LREPPGSAILRRMPKLAVIIPTRDRGLQAAEAAAAVLTDPADLELVVVDQSRDESTVQALAPLGRADRRVRIVRSPLRGASQARNAGVDATTAEVLAFTDDDCRPAPGWASGLLQVFAQQPEADLVFGRVHLPEGALEGGGFAASFEPRQRVQRKVPLPDEDIGVGANFAVRRSVLEALGRFDPLLGPGAPYFKAAEETDLLIRALTAGRCIVNAAECDVLHLGVRTGDAVRRLHVGYQVAVGAAFGKHARLSGAAGLRDCARWTAYYVRLIGGDLFHLRHPRVGVLAYFVGGALLTFRYRLNRRRKVLEERRRAVPPAVG
jgi:glycosyltransferase involved in cell wall biosynthesis